MLESVADRFRHNYSQPIRIREKYIIDQVWRPDPYFVNSKFSYFHMVSFPNFRMRIMPDGLVQYTLRQETGVYLPYKTI